MSDETVLEEEQAPHLLRRFGLLQAAALNMSNMVGIGPFITIPLLMSALRGPQAMLGWLVALAIVIPDGMIWSELGAMMPGSGGSYLYLREGFGRQTLGRLMAFLFIWQFILSGPLEIASGYIGFAQYAGYLRHGMTDTQMKLIAVAVGIVTIALLYRRITSIGTLTVALWIGTLLTMAAVIVPGIGHFNPKIAFDFPPHAFDFSLGFLFGLGAAARVGVYDYLGYYDVCYIGDEVREPGRVIPRSILISVLVIAVLYLGINLSIIGVVPWREFVPADNNPNANFVAAIFMQRLYGPGIAKVFVIMVLWTAFASVFALLLGYSRIPYAAATDGYFFKMFGRLHRTKDFPYVSLLVIGGISIACSFFSLDTVINALIATRIPVQFVGQIFAVALLRKHAADRTRPYRIWLYPVTPLIALVGWAFLFVTTERPVILLGLAILAVGLVVFLVWAWATRGWPFAPAVDPAAHEQFEQSFRQAQRPSQAPPRPQQSDAPGSSSNQGTYKSGPRPSHPGPQPSDQQRSQGRQDEHEYQQQSPPKPAPPQVPGSYAVLDLTPACTQEQAAEKYRELVRMYHPDKVNHLAPEYKDIAEKRMKEINAAYEELKKLRGW